MSIHDKHSSMIWLDVPGLMPNSLRHNFEYFSKDIERMNNQINIAASALNMPAGEIAKQLKQIVDKYSKNKEVTNMATIKFTLPNGATLEGTPDVVNSMLEKLGVAEDGVHYRSETKGLIPISTMDTRHIRNAILKIYRNWVDGLREVSDEQFVDALRKGAGSGNITLLALVKELTSRPRT